MGSAATFCAKVTSPRSAGGRVTFAASASHEEPEWEYEVQPRFCHTHT